MTLVDPKFIKDEVLLTVGCPIFPSILIAKNLLTGSLRNRSIDNLEISLRLEFGRNFLSVSRFKPYQRYSGN
jgi:hypothetical protein